MNKGSIKNQFLGQTAHRAPKLVALALSSCVLVTMVAIDASASPSLDAHAQARAQAHSVLWDWRSVAYQLRETELGKKVGRPVSIIAPSTVGTTGSGSTTTFTTIP